MKKNEKHEPYCGCADCKLCREEADDYWRDQAEIWSAQFKPVNQEEVDTADWPIVTPEMIAKQTEIEGR